jgi:D-sedoheptulose 7-phosphate isomerase
MTPSILLQSNLNKSIQGIRDVLNDKAIINEFECAANAVLKAYKKGGRIYIAGNGGSAADAQHLAAEFVSKLSKDRSPLPAEAMTVDSSVITAIGNDYGFEHIFARQVYGKMQENDIFLGITTSGNSLNIIKAIEACKEKKISSILLSGRDGGKAKKIADFAIVVPGKETSTIQEIHIILAHALCEFIETNLFNIS